MNNYYTIWYSRVDGIFTCVPGWEPLFKEDIYIQSCKNESEAAKRVEELNSLSNPLHLCKKIVELEDKIKDLED